MPDSAYLSPVCKRHGGKIPARTRCLILYNNLDGAVPQHKHIEEHPSSYAWKTIAWHDCQTTQFSTRFSMGVYSGGCRTDFGRGTLVINTVIQAFSVPSVLVQSFILPASLFERRPCVCLDIHTYFKCNKTGCIGRSRAKPEEVKKSSGYRRMGYERRKS